MRTAIVLVAASALLWGLAFLFSMLHEIPRTFTIINRSLALVMIIGILLWWVAEIFRGGGDPYR